MSALSDTTEINLYRRFRAWLASAEYITKREYYLITCVLFAIVTILVAGVGYLIREDKARVEDFNTALIKSCRDSNDVRHEVRTIIQDIKNLPYENANINTVLKRYARLTTAQAVLVDKRCTKSGPQP